MTDTNIDLQGEGTFGIASTSMSVLLQIPTGVTETVYLVAYMVDGAPLEAWGEMVGTVGLFDGVGNNVVVPVTNAGGPAGRPGIARHPLSPTDARESRSPGPSARGFVVSP